MKETITINEIDKLCDLSKLEFSDEDKQILLKEVSGIIEMLNQCDGVEIVNSNTLATQNLRHLREDEVGQEMETDDVFAATRHANNGYFVVPKVVE